MGRWSFQFHTVMVQCELPRERFVFAVSLSIHLLPSLPPAWQNGHLVRTYIVGAVIIEGQ